MAAREPQGWFAKTLNPIIRGAIKKFSGAGGAAGAAIGFVVDKIIAGASGQIHKLPKEVAFLPQKEQDAALKAHAEKGGKDAWEGIQMDFTSDINAWGEAQGISDPEMAKQAFMDEARKNPSGTLKDYLTGKGNFDRSSDIPGWAEGWTNAMNVYTEEKPLHDFVDPNDPLSGINIPDVTIDEIDFDDEGNIIDNSLKARGKRTFDKLFGEKQATVYPEDIVKMDGQDFVEGRMQDRNILGNLISKAKPLRYKSGKVFTGVNPSDIIDFDVEDPEGYAEIQKMIEDLDV